MGFLTVEAGNESNFVAEGLGQSHASSLVGGSFFVSHYEPKIVDLWFSCGVLGTSGSNNPSFPPLFHRVPQGPPNVWLWVPTSVSINYGVELF